MVKKHKIGEISGRAGQHWDKLESFFEEQIARTLNKLGVPSHKDADALRARIDELGRAVAKLSKTPAQAAKAARKTGAAKPAAKRSAARSTAA